LFTFISDAVVVVASSLQLPGGIFFPFSAFIEAAASVEEKNSGQASWNRRFWLLTLGVIDPESRQGQYPREGTGLNSFHMILT